MFQTLAQTLIYTKKIVGHKTLAIRRVNHHYGTLRRLLEILYIAALDGYNIAHHSRFYITARTGNHTAIGIVSIYLMVELTLGRVVVIDRAEKFSIEILPFLESKALAEHTRSDVLCNERSLDGQCSRTAHRIDEVALSTPAGEQNHTSSKNLVDGCGAGLHTVAATVQRLARTVEGKCTLLVSNMYMENKVGVVQAHRRTAALTLIEIVGNSVLHAVCHKF